MLENANFHFVAGKRAQRIGVFRYFVRLGRDKQRFHLILVCDRSVSPSRKCAPKTAPARGSFSPSPTTSTRTLATPPACPDTSPRCPSPRPSWNRAYNRHQAQTSLRQGSRLALKATNPPNPPPRPCLLH